MCGSASVFVKIGCGLLFLALVLQAVAVGTRYWMQAETTIDLVEITVGLWRYKSCPQGQSCSSGSVPDAYEDGEFRATQAFEIITLIVIVITFVLFCMYVVMERFRAFSVIIVLGTMCLLIVAFGMIGMIIWLTQLPDNFYAYFSFGLAVFAMILALIAAILLVPEIRTHNDRRRQAKPMKVSPYNDFSFNRRFTPTKFKGSNVRHYHNPNREKIMSESPPPTYRTLPSVRHEYSGTGTRAYMNSPDVFVGMQKY